MMSEQNKKQQERQRRSLQIEKFEDRVVLTASMAPAEPMEPVDVTLSQPVIEATEHVCQKGAQVNQLREGKGPAIWTREISSSVIEKLAPAGNENGVTVPYWNIASDSPSTGIWTDGTMTNLVEKLAPAVNDLWHDAIPEDDFEVAVDSHENGISFPEDLGPSGIWTDGTFTSVVEKLTLPGLAEPAKPTSVAGSVVENLAPTVDQIFHDAGEPDIPVVAGVSDNANGITFPDDLGPPGIWTDGTMSTVIDKLTAPRLTDLAKPNAVAGSALEQLTPPGLTDLAKPNAVASNVVVNLTPATDQIFHDAGEEDISVVASGSDELHPVREWLANVELQNWVQLEGFQRDLSRVDYYDTGTVKSLDTLPNTGNKALSWWQRALT